MSEAVLWKVAPDDVILGTHSGSRDVILITAERSGVALVEVGGGLLDRVPEKIWKVAKETVATCPAVLVDDRVVVTAVVPSQARVATPQRRRKGNSDAQDSASQSKSQLLAWNRDAEGLINDMTLLAEIDGFIIKLVLWEDNLIVAVTKLGSLYALKLVFEDGEINGKVVSQLDSSGISNVKCIDCSFVGKSLRAVALAGPKTGGAEIGVKIAMLNNIEADWALRDRPITSPSSRSGEDLQGFAAWVTAKDSDRIVMLWGSGILEVFECGELHLRKELNWKLEQEIAVSRSMSTKLKRKRPAMGVASTGNNSRVGLSMIRVGSSRIAIAGYAGSEKATSVGVLDTKFGKVSEILSIEEHYNARTLLGYQRGESIILGGLNVAFALYPTSANEWENSPIFLSDVLQHDGALTESVLKDCKSNTHSSQVESLTVGLRSPPDGETGSLKPQEVWIENSSQDLSNRVDEIMQDITLTGEPPSQGDLALLVFQILSLFFGDQIQISKERGSEISEDHLRKRLQDWKSILNKESSISKRIPSGVVQPLIEQFVTGKHWMLLEFLIATNHIVSCERYPTLIPSLLEERNINTLERLVVHVREFPPRSIFQILCMVLDSTHDPRSKEALSIFARRKRERVAAASEAFRKKSRPKTEEKVFMAVAEVSCKRFSNMEVCLHTFVAGSTDISVAKAAIRELNLRQALALIEYFGKWFDVYRIQPDLAPHPHARRPLLCVPSLTRTVDWISCLLDAHFTKLIHAEEAAPLVTYLQKSLAEHLAVSEHFSTLRGALHHIPRLAHMSAGAPSEDVVRDANPEMDLIIEQIHI